MNINTVRVFVNDEGNFGNPVGIMLDEGRKIDIKERQKIAKQSGYSECVFINDLKTSDVSIHNPLEEIAFAGHAIVGASWFMGKFMNLPHNYIVCGKSKIETWFKKDCTWIRAPLSVTPAWLLVGLKSPLEVEDLSPAETVKMKHAVVWSWENETKGIVRARTFAPDWGIPEDEANGSGAMRLAAQLGREIKVFHGEGSVICAKPDKNSCVSLGGNVVYGFSTVPTENK